MAKSLTQSAKTPPDKPKASKQYDLFSNFFGDSKNLSNTIELWDAIPKYAVSARIQSGLRDEKGNLPVHEQEFKYRPTAPGLPMEINCKVTIQPASVKSSDGSYIQYYPSADEEIVEEVLKKLFTDQQFGIHNAEKTESWVRFSLYMIQKELKERGKTRSIDEIKTSLEILSRAVYDVEFEGSSKKLIYTNPILNDMTRTQRTDYLQDPKSLWAARLPVLISKSVNELTYRQFNYGTLMSLPSPLARWFHKRLSHQYTQASVMHHYHIKFTSICRDSGLLNHSRRSVNIETVEKALQELKTAEVIFRYEKEERRRGRKIEDVKYTLHPSMDFVQEMKAANARQTKSREQSDNESRTTRVLR